MLTRAKLNAKAMLPREPSTLKALSASELPGRPPTVPSRLPPAQGTVNRKWMDGWVDLRRSWAAVQQFQGWPPFRTTAF